MKRKLFTLAMLSVMTVNGFADNNTGMQAFSSQTTSVSSYVPVVQTLCFAIAAVICVVGAYYAYYQIQADNGNARKAVMTSVGSAMCFVAMATALPTFFSIEETGGSSTISGDSGFHGSSVVIGDGTSILSGERHGIPETGINTEIPPLTDPRWKQII